MRPFTSNALIIRHHLHHSYHLLAFSVLKTLKHFNPLNKNNNLQNEEIFKMEVAAPCSSGLSETMIVRSPILASLQSKKHSK